jgi:hypothetical protein
MKTKNSIAVVITLLLGQLILVACSSQPDRSTDIAAIYQLLSLRETAIERKDIEAYKKLLFKDYSENGQGVAELVDDMRRTFANHETIDVGQPRTRPSITMNTARVIHSITFRMTGDDRSVTIYETLLLRKVEGQWAISGGIRTGLL